MDSTMMVSLKDQIGALWQRLSAHLRWSLHRLRLR